jgi:rhodanese-related sulfurtransferase
LSAVGKKDVRFEDLISREFIGSFQGSSAAELERAAAKFGAHAVTMRRITADMLRLSSHPIILHVKPNVRSNAYTHWVLFLGMEDGKARILDPPSAVELVPLADVLARWDGSGVIIADESISTGWFVWIARATFAALVAVGIGAVWLMRKRGWGAAGTSWRRDLRAAGDILILSVAIALAWHGIVPDGFLGNRSAVAAVEANYYSTFVPHLSAEELQALLDQGETTVIDARLARSYRRGHIDGAINVPIGSSLATREAALRDVPKSSPIVLYCQSEGCTWASELANVLAAHGYENLAIFAGGWREWSAKAQQEKSREP